MDFTEINTWSTNVVALIQIIASAVAVIIIAAVGLLTVVKGGDNQTREQARHMIIGVIVGLFIVFVATKGAQIVIGLNSFNPAAHPTPVPTPSGQ